MIATTTDIFADLDRLRLATVTPMSDHTFAVVKASVKPKVTEIAGKFLKGPIRCRG